MDDSVKDDASSIGKRIKLVRERLKLKQKEFADRLEYKNSMISDVEADKTTPSFALLKAMVDRFNISPTFVMTGQGQMFLNSKEIGVDDLDFGRMTPDILTLIDYLKKSELVKLSVIAHFRRFLLQNETIISKDIELSQSKNGI